jgi:sugar transferase (PEP-CTERM system associated)
VAIATASPPVRRYALVLGETALLGLACLLITGYEEFVHVLAHPALFSVNWTQVLSRVAIITLACQVSYAFQDLYDWRITSNRNETSVRLLQSIFYSSVLLGITYYTFNVLAKVMESPVLYGYRSSAWTTFAALVAVFPISYSYRAFFHWIFRRYQLNDRVLMLGTSSMAQTIEEALHRLNDPGYEIVGHVGAEPDSEVQLRAPNLGSADQLCQIALDHRVNRVIVALAERRGRLPLIELLNCRLAGIRVEESELLYERLTGKLAVQRLRPSYLIFSEGFQRSNLVFSIKRSLDVLMAVVGLMLLAPLCLLVSLVIKLDSRGSILYGQTRVGKDGRVFTTYKFRTMRSDAEPTGKPQWASANDSRVTRVGGFLRRTRIDEIPQMWNVLRNEMSFVGPRPERPFFVDELRRQIPYYMERLLVKPGITGWAQINYQYGSSVEDALTKLQYDLYYIKNLSIYMDLMILLRTIKVVVLRRGAV